MSRRPSDPPTPGGAGVLTVRTPAKVNLFLEVLGKRPDGYHAVETLMLAVDLCDTLEIRRTGGPGLELECDPPGLPTGPGNLVWKAADALRRATGTSDGAAVRLLKGVPHEAGLGGGSSDAAATLAALNTLWGLNLPRAELVKVAAEVGSDVGFFLTPPAGWCTGRGEVVEPETPGAGLDLVIVKPAVGLGTAEVYRRVSVPAVPASGADARAALRAGDVEKVARCLHNRLQVAAFAARPEVGDTHRRLAACGPLGCLMTGSGSAVFAVCRDPADADRVARRYEETTPAGSADRVFVVRSVRSAS